MIESFIKKNFLLIETGYVTETGMVMEKLDPSHWFVHSKKHNTPECFRIVNIEELKTFKFFTFPGQLDDYRNCPLLTWEGKKNSVQSDVEFAEKHKESILKAASKAASPQWNDLSELYDKNLKAD